MLRKWFFGTFVVFTTGALSHAADAIQLGKAEITKGIPGGSKLSVADIKRFLDEPANHKPLSPVLPDNLKAGSSAVFVPEDNPLTLAKIELGRQLYFDKRLSVDNTVSCADCHSPATGYGANTQFGVGVRGQLGGRNSPVSFNRILSKGQFWDGRAGTLEAQAVGPIANPIEMGNTHASVVKFVTANSGYRMQFEKVFGRAPNIDDIGKAIASFERAIVTGPSPYDLYEPVRQMMAAFPEELSDLETLKKDDPELYSKFTKAKEASAANPMSDSAKRGRDLFFSAKSNCSACHVGVNFTDELYHNIGVGMDAAAPDLGRFAETKVEKDKGAFKTPTVRNIAQTGPYMHDGSQKTLEEVVDWYAKGGHANPYLSDKIKKLDLTAQDKADLVEFMKALTGPLPKVETGRLPE
ncbi:MAG: cytochrome-c peroxidase [Pirellula sp.]|jgi:cytochrome c peroxidase|nr:c-type cytochrome [Pirellula sp.]